MKRKVLSVFFALVLVLSLSLVTGAGVVYAGSAFSNARTDFEPVMGRGVDDAWGHAIINYVKGQGVWEVNGSIHNLVPDTEYKIQIGIQNKPNPQFDVGSFTTDARGKADFHYEVIIPLSLDNYEIVRIVDPAGSHNPGVGGSIMMLAREDGALGLLQFRGGQRGK